MTILSTTKTEAQARSDQSIPWTCQKADKNQGNV